MAIARYEPTNLLNQFHQEIDRLLDRVMPFSTDASTVETSQWLPAIDIKEEPDRFVFYADIPGVDPKAIDVSTENNVLIIKGTRETESKTEEKGYSRIERVSGSFYRRFTLPDTADLEHITAHCRQGVLELEIPKREPAKSRKIKIDIND